MISGIHILIVDNYDSFTFNLVHLFESFEGVAATVKRPSEVELADFTFYTHIVFSPGPGLPSSSEKLMSLLAASVKSGKPVLGVCLGLQGLAQVTGGNLRNLTEVHHGVSHQITIEDQGNPLFSGLPPNFDAGRYHSWVVEESTLSLEWRISCRDQNGEIMAIRHLELPVFGIQFHPESVLTPEGPRILENFLSVQPVDKAHMAMGQMAG